MPVARVNARQVPAVRRRLRPALVLADYGRRMETKLVSPASCAQTALSDRVAVLMSPKGVGLRTACFLLAGLPELGSMDKDRSPSWLASHRSTATAARCAASG